MLELTQFILIKRIMAKIIGMQWVNSFFDRKPSSPSGKRDISRHALIMRNLDLHRAAAICCIISDHGGIVEQVALGTPWVRFGYFEPKRR